MPLSFNIKLPLSAYRDAPVETLETLHSRLKEYAVFPTGMYIVSTVKCLLAACICRLD